MLLQYTCNTLSLLLFARTSFSDLRNLYCSLLIKSR